MPTRMPTCDIRQSDTFEVRTVHPVSAGTVSHMYMRSLCILYHITLQEISRDTESAFEELRHMDKTVKCVREVVLDIQRTGQDIHAHLGWEPELNTTRQQVLGKHADKADIERAVQACCCPLRLFGT